jgi:gentisate 1,2-dioxygenase
MAHSGFDFLDRTGLAASSSAVSSPVVIAKEAIDAEVARLASLPAPANGRRLSIIRNPSTGVGDGLAPGTGVTLCVLKPGERTKPIRHNSSVINFCIDGAGHSVVDGRRIAFEQYDVWNTPPWVVYEHVNETDSLQVRLAYSNAPLLEKLQVHLVDENPPPVSVSIPDEDVAAPSGRTFELLKLNEDGAYLMPYEKLINPDLVQFAPLHWPWRQVKQELDKLASLGASYVGRRLYLMYHPVTGRTNGTTPNFFATITIRPANIVDKPHRHVAAAINYFFSGSGHSVVDGHRYTWKAGDLMLTAPGWAVHNHGSGNEPVYELTIQDSPLHIWMGSLLWQEDLRHPPQALGLSGGFDTNRETAGVKV